MEEHTVKRFDQELEELNSLVLRMGGLVQDQITRAMEALREENIEAARQVIARDHVVNFMDVEAIVQLNRREWSAAEFACRLKLSLGAVYTIHKLPYPKHETTYRQEPYNHDHGSSPITAWHVGHSLDC